MAIAHPQRSQAAILAVLIPASLFTCNAAEAQNQYFPSDGVIDQPSIGTLTTSVVGYANDADFSARINGTSPHMRVLAGAGGTFNALDVYNASVVDFEGGVYNSIHTYNQSTFRLTSGRVNAGFYAQTSGLVSILGGQIGFLVDGGRVEWRGGVIGGGGGGGGINVLGGAALDIFGSQLTQTLVNPNSSGFSVYSISGILGDGSVLQGKLVNVQNSPRGELFLHAVPAPTATALLALGGLLGARRRR